MSKNQLASIECVRRTAKKQGSVAEHVLLTLIDRGQSRPDIAMLLPEQNYNECVLAALSASANAPIPKASFVGLFLSDPFLHLPTALKELERVGVQGVTNFPSTSFYGGQFAHQLDEVGFSRKTEFERLAEVQEFGMAVAGCLPGDQTEDCLALAQGIVSPKFWIVHAGLESLFRSGVAPAEFRGMPGNLHEDAYLYDPQVDSETLPTGFAGYARADWW